MNSPLTEDPPTDASRSWGATLDQKVYISIFIKNLMRLYSSAMGILALSKEPRKQDDSPYLQIRKTPVIMTQY
ncbi:MAG: hypothetical protein V7L25_33095 [Nostoc sp.]|uniref:hypothetical protein n=1 Tax=Nostoc sp. TaxID=1180 RepID=UPI002FF37DB2